MRQLRLISINLIYLLTSFLQVHITKINIVNIRRWLGWQPKSVGSHRTGRRDALRFNTCSLHSYKSRNSPDDRKISSWRLWSLSESLLWIAAHASPGFEWRSWRSNGEELLSQMHGCIYAKKFPTPPHWRCLLWNWVPTHAFYGSSWISTKAGSKSVRTEVRFKWIAMLV